METLVPDVSNVDLTDLKIAYPNIDLDHVITLMNNDESSYYIASKEGVSQSCMTRLMRKIRSKTTALREFIDNRPDTLANLHNKSLTIQERVYDHFVTMDEDNFIGLDDKTKIHLLHTTGINANNIHNQERLERGQATEITANFDVAADLNTLIEQIKSSK